MQRISDHRSETLLETFQSEVSVAHLEQCLKDIFLHVWACVFLLSEEIVDGFDFGNYLGIVVTESYDDFQTFALKIFDKTLTLVANEDEITISQYLPRLFIHNFTNLKFEDKNYYYSIDNGDSLHSINQLTGVIETQSFTGINFLTNYMFGFDRYWKDVNSSNFKDIANRLSEQGVPVNQYIKAIGYITFNDLPVLISGFKLIGNDNDSSNTIKFYVDKNYRLPINPSSMKLPSGVSSESSKSEIITYVNQISWDYHYPMHSSYHITKIS